MNIEYEKDNKERIPFEHYLEEYRKLDPVEASHRTGVPYDPEKGMFEIRLMQKSYLVSWPDFSVQKAKTVDNQYGALLEETAAKIIVIRFLTKGVSSVGTGKFLTYREVPWGEVYFPPVQGRCLMRLAYGYAARQEQLPGRWKRSVPRGLNWGIFPMSLSLSTTILCVSSCGRRTRSFLPLPRFCFQTISLSLLRRRIWQWWEISQSAL